MAERMRPLEVEEKCPGRLSHVTANIARLRHLVSSVLEKQDTRTLEIPGGIEAEKAFGRAKGAMRDSEVKFVRELVSTGPGPFRGEACYYYGDRDGDRERFSGGNAPVGESATSGGNAPVGESTTSGGNTPVGESTTGGGRAPVGGSDTVGGSGSAGGRKLKKTVVRLTVREEKGSVEVLAAGTTKDDLEELLDRAAEAISGALEKVDRKASRVTNVTITDSVIHRSSILSDEENGSAK